MKTRETLFVDDMGPGLPDEAELAALRGWYAGLDARASVARYLGERRAGGACWARFAGSSSHTL